MLSSLKPAHSSRPVTTLIAATQAQPFAEKRPWERHQPKFWLGQPWQDANRTPTSAPCVQSSRFCNSAMTNFTTLFLLRGTVESGLICCSNCLTTGSGCPDNCSAKTRVWANTKFLVFGVEASCLEVAPLVMFAARGMLDHARFYFITDLLNLSSAPKSPQFFKVRVWQGSTFAGFLSFFKPFSSFSPPKKKRSWSWKSR